MRFYDARGRDRDCLTAEKLFKESLDHGYADAGVNLGYIYDKGCEPIAKVDHHALLTYLLCAKLGVALCENNVGAMIKHGRGIETADPARGYGWIKLAALHGNDLAKANLQGPAVHAHRASHRLGTIGGDPESTSHRSFHPAGHHARSLVLGVITEILRRAVGASRFR
jgi:TPR repeat protein